MAVSKRDTSLEMQAVRNRQLREMPPWRKLELLSELIAGARLLAEAGLRSRHLDAGEAEIKRRLAALLLGEETARRVYGELHDNA